MKIQTILGILLIIVGAAMLSNRVFTTTRNERIIDAGPIQLNADVQRTHIIPPLVSWAVVAGGVVLVLMSFKKG